MVSRAESSMRCWCVGYAIVTWCFEARESAVCFVGAEMACRMMPGWEFAGWITVSGLYL